MSASLLREAAALMRERAEAARPDHPWYDRGDIAEGMAAFTDSGDEPHIDAEHIASWHPAVALAVADWLDDHAETAEMFTAKEIPASSWSMNWQTSHNRALAVARAYLGESS